MENTFEREKEYFVDSILLKYDNGSGIYAVFDGSIHPDEIPFKFKMYLMDDSQKALIMQFLKESDFKLKIKFELVKDEKKANKNE